MATTVYIFSGLGADERVFQYLDFTENSVTFIKWIIPKPQESIENYATRLLEQIPTSNPILIGLSFGGMMAIEVAKQINTEKVIVIASAKTQQEIPFYYRWAGRMRLHKCLPTRLMKSGNFISYWLFGANSKSDKELLKQILLDTDPIFLTWAIDKIVHWRNQWLPPNITHVHGTSDRILPLCFVRCDLHIKQGGHLMTLNRADALNAILQTLL